MPDQARGHCSQPTWPGWSNNLLTAEAAPEPEPVQPTNLARLVNQLAADGAPKFDPTEHDPAKDHMSPASRLARLAAAPARLADETPYRDSTATAQQGPGGGNVPARPRPLVPPRSGHAPAPLWSPETPAGGSLGSCPEAAPNVKQERARRGSTEAAARKEEQQELLLERAIQAIHQVRCMPKTQSSLLFVYTTVCAHEPDTCLSFSMHRSLRLDAFICTADDFVGAGTRGMLMRKKRRRAKRRAQPWPRR